jgi:iron complex transport system ATP-binding protein
VAVSDPLVQIRGAGFKYGARTIFEDINLEVRHGEVLTILGPNGCGKSTLLRCVGGALALAQGSVHIGGDDLSKLDSIARARRVGFLFQDHTPSFPFLVLDVVTMGRTPYLSVFGAPSHSDIALAEKALEQTGTSHLAGRPYTELSGGERQMVLLARTLVQQPDVILLDEPTSHLDVKNQVRCMNMIGTLASHGVTMIMTSHDPNHAFLFSGPVGLMQANGSLILGSANSVITEAALAATYETDMGVFEVPDHGKTFKFCTPWRKG